MIWWNSLPNNPCTLIMAVSFCAVAIFQTSIQATSNNPCILKLPYFCSCHHLALKWQHMLFASGNCVAKVYICVRIEFNLVRNFLLLCTRNYMHTYWYKSNTCSSILHIHLAQRCSHYRRGHLSMKRGSRRRTERSLVEPQQHWDEEGVRPGCFGASRFSVASQERNASKLENHQR